MSRMRSQSPLLVWRSHTSSAYNLALRTRSLSSATPPRYNRDDDLIDGQGEALGRRLLRAAAAFGQPPAVQKQGYVNHGFKELKKRPGVSSTLKVYVDPVKMDALAGSNPSGSRGKPPSSSGRGNLRTTSSDPSTRRSFSTSARSPADASLAEFVKGQAPSLMETPYDLDEMGVENLELGVNEDVVAVVHTGTNAKTHGGEFVPGSWIEMRRMAFPLFGVYLGPSEANLGFHYMAIASGTQMRISGNDITYVLPAFSSPTDATALLKDASLTHIALTLSQKMRALEVQLEDATRTVLAAGFTDLYRRLQLRPQPNSGITAGAALTTLGIRTASKDHKRSHLLEMAMHRLLMSEAELYNADPIQHRTSGLFTPRPAEEVANFRLVQACVRAGAESAELRAFAAKAATARAFGQANPPVFARASGADLKVWDPEVVGVKWTPEDQHFLRFLNLSLGQDRLLQAQPYLTYAPTIIKLVDDYSRRLGSAPSPVSVDQTKIGREEIMQFMSEIGVVAPWEDWVAQDETAGITKWAKMDSRPRFASKSAAKIGAVLSPQDFHPTDPHAAVRHDFGNLPVYAIDDPGAQELDDGVSLSSSTRVSSTGSPAHWVHVHVADPTALLHPAHEISQIAQLRDHSEYLPESTWSMLPAWFIKGKGLSLGSKMGGPEEKTLSFSTLVAESGEVLDIKVRAGIVNNVLRFTYRAVSEVLGAGQPAPPRTPVTVLTYPLLPPDYVAPRPILRTTDDQLLATDLATVHQLTTLHRLAKVLLRKRVEANALAWQFPPPTVTISTRLLPTSPSSVPTFYAEAPNISLELPGPEPNLDPSAAAQLLVTELMICANRTAARFAVEHGLPVPYRSQDKPKVSPEIMQKLLDLRNEYGAVSTQDVVRMGFEVAPASESAVPGGPHWVMGIQDNGGYIRATSPLRRYSDLLSHWQIKSALLGGKGELSLAAVTSCIQKFAAAKKMRGKLGYNANVYWALYLLKAKMSPTSEDALASHILANLTAMILRAPTLNTYEAKWVTTVQIVELGIRAQLTVKNQEDIPGLGDVVPVKIDLIALSNRSRAIVVLR